MKKPDNFMYGYGDYLVKRSGSEWSGFVVGFYSSSLTEKGYAIESSVHVGSVQIYPEHALQSSERTAK